MSRRPRTDPRPPRPDGFDQWTAETFEIAYLWGVESEAEERIRRVDGWTYRGVGMHRHSSMTARYRRKDGTRKLYESWTITHLNTGHSIRILVHEPAASAFALVTDLADMADWTFDGLDGWKNVCPEMPELMAAWHRRHNLGARQAGGGGDENVARAIGMKRW